jgi:hypothetical protein
MEAGFATRIMRLSTSAAMAVSPLLARQDAGAQLWSDDRLVAPDRGFHETAPLQASFVGRPILDPIAGLRDAVTASGICLNGMPEIVTAQPQPGRPPQLPAARYTNAGGSPLALLKVTKLEEYIGEAWAGAAEAETPLP